MRRTATRSVAPPRESYIELRSILGKALDYAMRRKLVTSNIARHVELPAEAPRTEPGRALTIDQANYSRRATMVCQPATGIMRYPIGGPT